MLTYISAQLTVGNILPVGSCPEGTIVCNVEVHAGDKGKLARCSGDYAIVVSHDEDSGKSKLRLPSGGKLSVTSNCRCMIGMIAGE